MNRDGLLHTVGERVRTRREALALTRRDVAGRSGLSERFLADLESGRGNISLARFAELAAALAVSPAALIDGLELGRPTAIALIGLRGAGKSTVGRALAERRAVPFVEVDQRIEEAAGLSLGELFELHGEAHYRVLERRVLGELLDGSARVLATGGSIVSDASTYAMLRARARTVWLKARPEDHWDRVLRQGDNRPMAENPHAFAQLRELLATREGLYAGAELAVDTSGRAIAEIVGEVDARLR